MSNGTSTATSDSVTEGQTSLPGNAWSIPKNNGELIVLLLISFFTAIPFALKGIAAGDPLMYAGGLLKMLSHGIGEIPGSFNAEMSLAYYLVAYGLLKLVGPTFDVGTVLNLFNAVISVVLQLLLYFFFSKVTSRRWVRFFACLAVLLAPNVWLLSHEGHPALLGFTFFVGALLVLDRILWDVTNDVRVRWLWVWFVLLCLLTMAVRLDVSLCFGAFLGLVLFRHAFSSRLLIRGLIALLVTGLLYAGFRYFILGYIFPVHGGTFGHHLMTRLSPSTAAGSIIKNGAMWMMGTNILVFLLAIMGLLFHRGKPRLVILALFMIAPWCLILPFRSMDLSRIAVPSVPILALLAMEFVASRASRRPVLALAATLVLAQLVSVVLYVPLERNYPFHVRVKDRPIADVPIGFLPVDNYYRQLAIEQDQKISKEVTSRRDANVGIIGHHTARYLFWLGQADDLAVRSDESFKGLIYSKWATGPVEFYLCDLGENMGVSDPFGTFKELLEGKNAKIHMIPFSRDERMDSAMQ